MLCGERRVRRGVVVLRRGRQGCFVRVNKPKNFEAVCHSVGVFDAVDANAPCGRLRLRELLSGSRVAEFVQITECLLLVRGKSAHEFRVVELGVLLSGRHAIEDAQAAQEQLAALRGHRLPAWEKIVANILTLFGRHLPENFLAPAKLVFLLRRKLIPFLEILTNLRLALGQKAAETRVVLHEAILFFR